MIHKRFYLLLFISGLLFRTFPFNYTSIPIDGFNAFQYDTLDYLVNANFSLSSGNSNDSFPVVSKLKMDFPSSRKLFPVLQFTGLMGSEFGDPLLNKYNSSVSYQNRDHVTNFSLIARSPTIPLVMAYRYRYLDTYSDRFDSIWGNNPMVNSEKGLSHEHFAMARYQSPRLSVEMVYNWYERWAVTPYYFSPFFIQGFTISPQLQYGYKSITFYSLWILNKHSDYNDHISPLDYTDLSGRSGITVPLHLNIKSTLEFNYDNSLDPKTSLSMKLYKWNQDSRFNWGISGSLFSDISVAANLYGTIKIVPQLLCSLNVARDHMQKIRPYTFTENLTEVEYVPMKIDQTNFYGSLNFKDTLLFPVSAALWIRFCNNPLQEKILFTKNRTIIKQDTSESSAALFAGLHGTYSLLFKSVHCDLTPTIIYPLDKSLQHFKLPKRGKIALYYVQQIENPAVASIVITYKGKSSLNYLLENGTSAIQSFEAPENTSLNFHLRIPFPTPLVSASVKNTAFVFDCGPIRLAKQQRVLEHPRGNLIGPGVYAGVEGIFR